MTYPSLTKLRSFAAIAAHRSFRKASAQMNLSQPALSALEHHDQMAQQA